MRRQLPVTISSLVFAAIPLLAFLIGRANDGFLDSVNAVPVTNKRVVVNAAGRGNPSINLADGVEVAAECAGNFEAQLLLRQGAAEPRAVASADFCGCKHERRGQAGNIGSDRAIPRSPVGGKPTSEDLASHRVARPWEASSNVRL